MGTLNNHPRDSIQKWREGFELWFVKAARIARIMIRGAYWLGQRKRLMASLGAKVYEGMKHPPLDPKAVDPLVGLIDKINDKLESEEAHIRDIRYENAQKGNPHADRVD